MKDICRQSNFGGDLKNNNKNFVTVSDGTMMGRILPE